MTEQEWLACTDPFFMEAFLSGKASPRKMMLSSLACCRRIWHLLTDGRIRNGIEVAEQYADGQANEEELTAGLAVWGAWLYPAGEPGWIASYRSATTRIRKSTVYALQTDTVLRVYDGTIVFEELESEHCALF